MSRIVAAIDTTPAAATVLAAAAGLAPLLGAHVEALHVLEDDARVPRALSEGFDVPLRVVRGEVVRILMDLAGRPDDVVAVVTGVSERRHHLPFIGHVAEHVLTHAAIPVVAVPPGAAVTSVVRRVLVPLNGTATTSAALREVLEMACRKHLDVTLLHVYDDTSVPMFSDQPVHEARAWTEEFLRRHCPDPDAVSLEVRIGTPATHVMDVAVESRADLLVLGWSQDFSSGRARVVRHALETSGIPVLLVPVAHRAASEAPAGDPATAGLA
jgi:nucleotide-binding universal stress UspA family protein